MKTHCASDAARRARVCLLKCIVLSNNVSVYYIFININFHNRAAQWRRQKLLPRFGRRYLLRFWCLPSLQVIPLVPGGKVCAPVLLLPIYNIRKVYPFRSINKDEYVLLGTEYGIMFHRFFFSQIIKSDRIN